MAAGLTTDVLLTDVERAVQEGVREAAAELTALAAVADAEPQLDARLEKVRALYRPLFELGLHRAVLPPELEGMGLSMRARVVLLEELGRADAGAALAIGATWSALALIHVFGTDAARAAFNAPCAGDASGAQVMAVAVSEPDRGSDALNFVRDTRLGTTLKKSAAGFELSGTKWMMTNGGAAATYVVGAQTDAPGFQGRALVVVPATAAGLQAAPVAKRGLRTAFHGTVNFDRVKVPAEHVLRLPEQRDEGRSVALGAVEVAGICVGVAQAALELADRHAAEREQGGKRVREHQAVALRLGELQGQIAAARALSWQSAELADLGALELQQGAAARAVALDAARDACTVATEVVGSPAIEERHPLAKLSRDAETLAIPSGTPDLLRLLSRGIG